MAKEQVDEGGMEEDSAIGPGIELSVSNKQTDEFNYIDSNGKGEIPRITKEKNNVSTKYQSNQSPTTSTANSTQPSELTFDGDDSCESQSTCTILEQLSVQNHKDKSLPQATTSDQILSISNLDLAEDRQEESEEEFEEANRYDRHEEDDKNRRLKDDTSVEIELEPSTVINREEEKVRNSEIRDNMFAGYHRQTPLSSQEIRNFNELKPKLSFSSQRMKEYFETFKSSSAETIRLYQFFKSTRTELVACLLFTLITSQALIISKTHLNDNDASSMTWPLISVEDVVSMDRNIKSVDKNIYVSNQNNHESGSSNVLFGKRYYDFLLGEKRKKKRSNRVGVHLASGLVMSFTVTSLTQVFGHISGCHLLPSISLALFIKGHISRARLVSYLVAQSVGSLLGVSLLSVLTSSQITPEEYRQLLFSGSETKYSSGNIVEGAGDEGRRGGGGGGFRLGKEAAAGAEALKSVAIDTIISRRKREADDFGPDINLNGIQGSETILISIVEQQQEHQLQKQHRQQKNQQQQNGKSLGFDKREIDEERTISADGGPGEKSLHQQEQPPYSTPDTSYQKPPTFESEHTSSSREELRPKEGVALGHQSSYSNGTSNTHPSAPFTIASAFSSHSYSSSVPKRNPLTGSLDVLNETSSLNDKSRVSKHATGITTTILSDQQATTFEVPQASVNDFQRRPVIPGDLRTITTTNYSNYNDNQVLLLEKPVRSQSDSLSSMSTAKQVKLRRKKRNKTQQQVNITTNAIHRERNKTNYNYYINMLEFALPDSIMSSDSIRQCIEKQQKIENNIEFANVMFEISSKTAPPSIADIQQMAERSFQSCLSLSNSSQMFIFQFLATLLIVLTYLINVDPRRVDLGFKSLSIGLSYFVASALTVQSGGFFGSPFHVLFLNWFVPSSSWKVEWSIYLFTPFIAGLFGAISHEYIDFTSLRNRDKQLRLRRSFCSLDNLPGTYNNVNGNNNNSNKTIHNDNGYQAQGGLEISTLSNLVGAPGRAKRISSSSSLESTGATSSVLTSAEDHHCINPQQQGNHLFKPEAQSGSNTKKALSYSRQLKLEQRQQLQLLANGSNLMPKTSKNIILKVGTSRAHNDNSSSNIRKFDFDSNFLISSSTTANCRNQSNTSGFM